MPHKGHTGAQTHTELSPAKKKSRARKRRLEEASWQAKNGPVVVSYVVKDDNQGAINE